MEVNRSLNGLPALLAKMGTHSSGKPLHAALQPENVRADSQARGWHGIKQAWLGSREAGPHGGGKGSKEGSLTLSKGNFLCTVLEESSTQPAQAHLWEWEPPDGSAGWVLHCTWSWNTAAFAGRLK